MKFFPVLKKFTKASIYLNIILHSNRSRNVKSKELHFPVLTLIYWYELKLKLHWSVLTLKILLFVWLYIPVSKLQIK